MDNSHACSHYRRSDEVGIVSWKLDSMAKHTSVGGALGGHKGTGQCINTKEEVEVS